MTAERRLKMELGTRDDDVRDDASRGGLLHRTRHLKGWGKWMHGHNCPRCGASCHDREDRNRHDSWHRDDDGAWEEWSEELTDLKERVTILEAQHALIAETFGHALAPLVGESDGGR